MTGLCSLFASQPKRGRVKSFPWILAFAAVFSGAYGQSLIFDLADSSPAKGFTRVFGHGSPGDGRFGVPVCGGYDVDGDGFNDYAFAQFLSDPLGRTDAGVVTLVFGDGRVVETSGGGATRRIEKDTQSPTPDILHIAGGVAFETTGSEIWMDDVNGDGLGDLLIARQNYSPSLTNRARPGAGALTVVFGSSALRDLAGANRGTERNGLDLGSVPSSVSLLTLVGQQGYGRLGIWMRTGDITGDGVADILVGADEEDAPGASITYNSGACYVLRGGSHLSDMPGELVDLAEFGKTTFPEGLKGHVVRLTPPSGSADYHFGGTVQVADLDGNGRAEVLIAATLNRAGASIALPGAPAGTGEGRGGSLDGTLFIIWDENFPPGPWPVDYALSADGQRLDSAGGAAPGDFTRIDGAASNRSFGEEILGGMDFDADGLPELYVGDLAASPLGRVSAGEGTIFYAARGLRGLNFSLDEPPPGVALTRVYGPVRGAISSDTALQGDFDGDGIADLAIGNPHDNPVVSGRTRLSAGSVSVLYGQAGGWPATVDLFPANLPPEDELRLALMIGANGTLGSNTGDTLCYSAASGDIDGNGIPDLVVNEMVGDGFGGAPSDVGNLVIIRGRDLLAQSAPPLTADVGPLLDFGVVDAGAAAILHRVVLTNAGAAAVTLGVPRISHLTGGTGFAIASFCAGTVLAPGSLCEVGLTYTAPALSPEPGEPPVVLGRFEVPTDAGTVRFALRVLRAEAAKASPVLRKDLFADAVALSLESAWGTDYRLQTSEDVVLWTEVADVEGTGARLYFTRSLGTEEGVGPVYYRVLTEPHRRDPDRPRESVR